MRRDYSNREFVSNVLDWNFGLKGILRVSRVSSTNQGAAGEQISEIRIKDILEYEVELLSYDHALKKWLPYIADDLMLEFIMLDPYIRMPLAHQQGKALYKATF